MIDTLKKTLKSRTVWLAIILAVLSVLQGYVAQLPMTPFQQMVVGIVLAVLITLFRAATTVPLSQK